MKKIISNPILFTKKRKRTPLYPESLGHSDLSHNLARAESQLSRNSSTLKYPSSFTRTISDILPQFTTSVPDFKVEIVSKKGARKTQEDAHVATHLATIGAPFFAVYDGHGGPYVSEYLQTHLHSRLETNLVKVSRDLKPELVTKVIKETISEIDKEILDKAKDRASRIHPRMGSTLSAVLVIDEYAYCIQLGDSAVFLLRDKTLKQITYIHELKPNNPEAKRILEQGGFLGYTPRDKDKKQLRINGELAVPKAMGDHHYMDASKNKLVSSDPFISGTKLQVGDSLLIVCDGLFGPLTKEHMEKLLTDSLRRRDRILLSHHGATTPLSKLTFAAERGQGSEISTDNMTSLLATYNPSPMEETEEEDLPSTQEYTYEEDQI